MTKRIAVSLAGLVVIFMVWNGCASLWRRSGPYWPGYKEKEEKCTIGSATEMKPAEDFWGREYYYFSAIIAVDADTMAAIISFLKKENGSGTWLEIQRVSVAPGIHSIVVCPASRTPGFTKEHGYTEAVDNWRVQLSVSKRLTFTAERGHNYVIVDGRAKSGYWAPGVKDEKTDKIVSNEWQMPSRNKPLW